jgi:hypothetical protein
MGLFNRDMRAPPPPKSSTGLSVLSNRLAKRRFASCVFRYRREGRTRSQLECKSAVGIASREQCHHATRQIGRVYPSDIDIVLGAAHYQCTDRELNGQAPILFGAALLISPCPP